MLLSLLLLAQTPHFVATPAWKAGQEDRIREEMIVRLFNDYCRPPRRAKVVFVNVGNHAVLKAPSERLLTRLHARLPVRVKSANPLKEDVAYMEQEVRDPESWEKAPMLSVRSISWKSPSRVVVDADYGIKSAFILDAMYVVTRSGSTWRVLGERPTPPSVVSGVSRSHRWKMLLHQRRFELWNHRVTGSPGQYHVDGQFPVIGEEGGVPSTEPDRFQVWVDGKEWKVPKRLWGDCHALWLRSRKGARRKAAA